MALADTLSHHKPIDVLSAPYVRPRTRSTIAIVLWTLFDLGGEFRDDVSGRAARKLFEEAVKLGYRVPEQYLNDHTSSSISNVIRHMDVGDYAGLISREVATKRTKAIKLLVPEADLPPRPPRLSIQANGSPTKPTTETVLDPEPPEPEPEPDIPEPEEVEVEELSEPEPDAQLSVAIDEPDVVLPKVPELTLVEVDPIDALLMIQQLAMGAAITFAGQLGQTADPAPDRSELDDAKAKLAETLEENQRFRRKLAEASETLVAKSREIEALRKALMTASSNLKAMQAAANQGNDIERKLKNLKATERFMQAPPVKAGIGNKAVV